MLFEKWRKKKKGSQKISYENLSVPEYHTGKCHHQESEKNENTSLYENLAIPEVHVHKKQKKTDV